MPLPFPDALQEFKVETSTLTAANGVHAGGTVTGVTIPALTPSMAMCLSSSGTAI